MIQGKRSLLVELPQPERPGGIAFPLSTSRSKGVVLMNEPVTTMDTRYSEPDGVVTQWDETRRVLETAELFWISTVRADGRPHVTPVVAVWADGAIHFSTGAEEQKYFNLRANPQVVLTTGCTRWDTALHVVLEADPAQLTA